MKSVYIVLGLLMVIVLVTTESCYKETFRESDDTFLEFSRDTLSFDTVFTTLGSATRYVKAYNPYNESVLIDRIYLDGQSGSTFRLNIDGEKTNDARNIEILPQDSMYIFVEVTIDPDAPNSISPFVIEDYVHFEVNGNNQKVLLDAWGQNANYIPSNQGSGTASLLCSDFNTVVFDDPRPYVIYGILVIDSCSLVMPPGTDVYVHGGVVTTENGPYADGIIVVGKNGKLLIQGTVDNQVTIQGDRLEEEFNEIAGQWTGIILQAESEGTEISHALIKNSIVGLSIDSLASVKVFNSTFSNQSSTGIAGFHAKDVYLENCLIEGSGSNSINFAYGGKLEINYSTIVNYDSGGSAIAASNFRCTEPTCLGELLYNPVDVKIRNSIMVGDDSDQIVFSDQALIDGTFDYSLEHCIVRVDELLDVPKFANFFDNCLNCIQAKPLDTLFYDRYEDNFMLDTLSIAEGKAIPINGILNDQLEIPRDVSTPDIGCFEYEY